MDLKSYIREVPDFPKPGIGFKDIMPLLQDKEAFRAAIDDLYEMVQGYDFDKIVAIESRGFILGGALANKMGVGFIPVRKKGKLPSEVISYTYQLEYGEDTLEMHEDSLVKGERVLILDDLLATGGTVSAAINMVSQLGASVVLVAFLIELKFLSGREKIKDYPIKSLIQF
ncbi:MAG: adenine phosphoribosyltransferase [Candidatus Saelkia tenebricola]|nr:adenine phosphoribosyltransferase [Candidatus Saelkia tenebricola]